MKPMISRTFALSFVLSCTITLLVALPMAARSHDAATYYTNGTWAGDEPWSIGRMALANATGDLAAADDPWNAVAGSGFDFYYNSANNDSGVTYGGNTCAMPGPDSWVVSAVLSGSYLGMTTRCFNVTGQMTEFAIRMDEDRTNWCIGCSTVSTGKYDFKGVAVHEFGHATGWHGHLPTADCSSGLYLPTMCPEIGSGLTYWRSLEAHDVHTFDAAYN